MNILSKIKQWLRRNDEPKLYAVLMYDGMNYIVSSSVYNTYDEAKRWADTLEARSLTVLGIVSFNYP